MIKLKNGFVVPYDRDIDAFLNSLADSIIRESMRSLSIPRDTSEEFYYEAVLKEIMDNCIFVTHQVLELFKSDENAGRLLVSGFLFNFVIQVFRAIESPFSPGFYHGPGGGNGTISH